ncbi:regulatory protein RecX [Leptotrichia hongkongensis]|jgi:recX family|uniref:Regulatory protein RecX n=1 Tax=Leptotrichia hongkongensis TaxID=554406 RepID=A0A510L4K7_9FUSO|nr:regulatory protein RecX [Leptotrichia hongkongensis]BBM58924.1 regulatory protein RecX [Leptotrichia hongkongensis]
MKINKIYRNKIYLDNEEIMDISPLIRQKYDLKVNDNIERFYDEISYEASLEKGIFLISLKDRTKKEIRLKLQEKFRNKSAILQAIEKLEELGYLNDLNYAISYIEGRTYGKNRISYNLFQKGIDKVTVEKAYLTLDEEKEDNVDDTKLEKLIEKNSKKININNEREEKKLKEEQKFIQYLARQGFSLDKIFKKLKEYKENYE